MTRLGCLPYLNVRPLTYTLEHGGMPDGWEFVYAPPSKLARMLEEGYLAAAPVSIFACIANPTLDICPEICISSNGPVRSVLILSRVPAKEISRVALDTSSLSGANYARIILSESYGACPEFTRVEPDILRMGVSDDVDAVLLIGDEAMLFNKDGLHVIDVGDEWTKLTGLPAVFAVWAGHGINDELVSIFHEAKRAGMSMLRQIAREESIRLNLSFETCYEYLSNIIKYNMGEREIQSIEVFRRKAQAHDLLAPEVFAR